MSGPRWSSDELRAMMSRLPTMAASDRFLVLEEQVRTQLAPMLVGRARRMGVEVETAAVVSLVLTHVVASTGCPAEAEPVWVKVVLASDPWGYLASCSLQWLHEEEIGHRSTPLELVGDLADDPRRAAELAASHEAVSEAVELTRNILVPRSPAPLREAVGGLVQWSAFNPPQRLSYEREEIRAATASFTGLTMPQVKAVTVATWGGRPNQAATSILGAFLEDRDFPVFRSPSHARAVRRFKDRMTA